MDYMREINAFYDRLETSPLATSSIALWHALMSIANKAGWPDKFAVAVSVLEGKTSLKRDAIFGARNKLQQHGYIRWKSRDGNQSAEYEMLSLARCVVLTDTVAHTVSHTKPTQLPTQLATQLTTITKRKLDETNTSSNGARYCSDNLMAMSGGNFEALRELMDAGVADELVVFAVDEACANGKRTWSYVNTILNRLLVSGIQTVGDAKADAAKRKNKPQPENPPDSGLRWVE